MHTLTPQKQTRAAACALLAATLLALAASAALSPTAAHACEPPFTAWYVQGTFPADGDEAAPINGVIAFDLDFISNASSTRAENWPTVEVFDETVEREVLRAGVEPVPGVWEYDPVFGQMRFVAERVFAEGVEYTVNVTFKNSLFEDFGIDDEVYTLAFTTGNELDQNPPAFSGLQTLTLTETARATRECCLAADEDACPCEPSCQWCWVTGYVYPPSSAISFRTSADEFGAATTSYAIYRVDSDDPADLPGVDDAPLKVIKDADGEISLTFVHDPDDPGPFCFFVEAHDIFGRTDPNVTVICRDLDDLEPIAREEVPDPDRSGCAEEDNNAMNPDAGPDADTSDDAGVNNNGGPNNTTTTPDASIPDAAPDAPDDEDDASNIPNVTTSAGGNDDGCFCATPGARRGTGWGFVAGLLLVGVALGRRRRG